MSTEAIKWQDVMPETGFANDLNDTLKKQRDVHATVAAWAAEPHGLYIPGFQENAEFARAAFDNVAKSILNAKDMPDSQKAGCLAGVVCLLETERIVSSTRDFPDLTPADYPDFLRTAASFQKNIDNVGSAKTRTLARNEYNYRQLSSATMVMRAKRPGEILKPNQRRERPEQSKSIVRQVLDTPKLPIGLGVMIVGGLAGVYYSLKPEVSDR